MIIYVRMYKEKTLAFHNFQAEIASCLQRVGQCSLRHLGTLDNHPPLSYSNTVEMTLNTTCKHEE